MSKTLQIFLALFLLIFAIDTAWAERRVALVIGINRYDKLVSLANPGRDAEAIAGVLKKSGFETSLHLDLNQAQMEKAVVDFAAHSAGATQAIIYFAGHGMSVVQGGKLVNVIAPSDANVSCADRSAARVVAMDKLFAATADIPERVLLFDACRYDPFLQCPASASVAARGFGFRAVGQEATGEAVALGGDEQGRGLARVGSARRSAAALVGFSTDLGAVALDGKPGTHSPFADELLKQLDAAPDMPLRELLDRTSQAVAKETAYLQVPWVVSKGGEPQICLSGNCRTRTLLEAGRTEADVATLLRHARSQIKVHNYEDALAFSTEGLSLSQTQAGDAQHAEAEAVVRTSLAARRAYEELEGSTGHVSSLSYSKSGRYALALSDKHDQGTAVVWDTATGKKLNTLRNDDGPIIAAHFRGKSDEVVTVSRTGRISVWNARSGKRRLRTKPLKHTINAVAISANGSRLALGTGDQFEGMEEVLTVRGVSYVIDLKTGKRVGRVKTRGQLDSLALDPRGALLSVGLTGKSRGFVWNVRRKKRAFRTSVTDGTKSLQRFSSNGRYLAMSGIDSSFEVYDVKRRRKLKRTFAHRSGSFLQDFAFDPTQSKIGSVGSDGFVSIWDLQKNVGPRNIELRDGYLKQVRFSNDGRHLFVGIGQLVHVVDIENLRSRAVLSVRGVKKPTAYAPEPNSLHKFALHPTAGKLLVKFDNSPLRQYATEETSAAPQIPARLSAASDHAGYSRDGKWMLIAEGRRLRIFDAATGELRKDVGYKYQSEASPTSTYVELGGVTHDRGSQSGLMAFMGHDKSVGLLRLPDLKVMKRVPTSDRPLHSARISPDGSLLMLGQSYSFTRNEACREHIIRIVHLSSLEDYELCGPFFSTHLNPPTFSPDSRYLVSAGYDGKLRLFDLKKRSVKELVPGREFGKSVSPVFTSDGKKVIAALKQKGAVVIRVTDGKKLYEVNDIPGGITGIAASADGSRFAVSSQAQAVFLVDAATGHTQEVYEGYGKLSIGAFDPSNRGLVFASYTGVETRRFQMKGEALLAHAIQMTTGCLAKEVRERLKLQAPAPNWCATLQVISDIR